MKKLLIVTVLALQTAPVLADTGITQRTISVSGEAREEVAPDQAVLNVALVSKDNVLATAKKANDALAEKLVAITKKFEIPREKIATSSINVNPDYTYSPQNQQIFNGYTVARSLRITIDKLDTQEKLLSAIIDAKIDQVNGVEFQLANPEAHEASLRVKAFENAKAKADALAKAAGGKLGPPITIVTEGAQPIMAPRPMMMAKAMSASSVAPSLPGLITLQENVSVTFGLE